MAKRKSSRTYSPLKAHGGKFYLAPWIVGLMPKVISTYVEPFMFGYNVRFALPGRVGVQAVVGGDIDWKKPNLFRVIQDPNLCGGLILGLQNTEYTKETFIRARDCLPSLKAPDPLDRTGQVEAARIYLISNRMSRGGLGDSFGWSKRLRGGRPGDLNGWLNMVDGLPDISTIIRHDRIVIGDFRETMLPYLGDPSAVLYLDPTYMPDTRSVKDAYGKFEMSLKDHEEMCDLIKDPATKAKVILSGYDNFVYRKRIGHLHREEKEIANHSGQGEIKERRREVLWMNYNPQELSAHAQEQKAAA